MYGNVLNNTQVRNLIEGKKIEIVPFDSDALDLIHYPLLPCTIYVRDGRKEDGLSKVKSVASHVEEDSEFVLKPRQSVLVQTEQLVSFADGIVAQFTTPYQLIDTGFQLNAGRLSSQFGKQSRKLVFGVTNLLDIDNTLDLKSPIAYIYFIDFSALNNSNPNKKGEEERYRKWFHKFARERDDGVFPRD